MKGRPLPVTAKSWASCSMQLVGWEVCLQERIGSSQSLRQSAARPQTGHLSFVGAAPDHSNESPDPQFSMLGM
jgi:hypothetical protein